MPNRRHERKRMLASGRHRRWLLSFNVVVPLSAFSFAIAASAQTAPSEKQGSSTGANEAKTPSAVSNSPSFSRGAPTGTTPSPLVSEVTIEEPGLPAANRPPSFYAAPETSANSSLGLPGFAAVGSSVQSPTAANYPLQWGPFSAHPHLGYGLTYGTGVLFTPGRPTTTLSHSLSPGLTIVSRHISLDYTPSLIYYSKGPYDDSLNHSASLSAGFNYGDWRFGISQGFQKSSQPLIETAAQTDTTSYSTGLSASWNFSEKWFFDFSFSQTIQDIGESSAGQGLQSSRSWSSMEWANYRITPHLSAGVGIGGGFTEQGSGSNSTFEQVQGRLNWNPSKKLSLNLNGGIEIRQFLDSPDSDNLVNPIMGAGISYQLFEPTSLHLNANRGVNTSLFSNEINETTSISGGVSQRLFGRFQLGVSAGYHTTDYKNISSTRVNRRFLNVDRSDDVTFVSTSLGTSFLKKGSISVAYQHSKNDSNLAGYTYDSDQFTFNIGYRF